MTRLRKNKAMFFIAAFICGALITGAESEAYATSYGLDHRPVAKPFLNMPPRADGKFPALLSATGAFQDTRSLKLNAALLPYDLVVSFWSDGAVKSRAVAIGPGKIGFSPAGEWTFPSGTVFVKTFELAIDEARPDITRRLETRLLVLVEDGGVYGAVYKWRPDQTDAELLDGAATEVVGIKMANGQMRGQSWYYPSRKDCLTCHTQGAGGVLGLKTRQMNRDFGYASGITDNQLRTWNHLRLFEPAISDEAMPRFAKLVSTSDVAQPLEARARSYLDANCAHCHRPGGTVAHFDARFETPLEKQGLVDGPVLIDEGIDRARVVSPHDPSRSIALMRMNAVGDIRMPPLARETIDTAGVALMTAWIKSMPGQDVLAPPKIVPVGGPYDRPVEVSLSSSETDADIRYTLDGSAPGPSDLRYTTPIKLTEPTVLRARAFKPGFTRSITVQEVFVIEK